MTVEDTKVETDMMMGQKDIQELGDIQEPEGIQMELRDIQDQRDRRDIQKEDRGKNLLPH